MRQRIQTRAVRTGIAMRWPSIFATSDHAGLALEELLEESRGARGIIRQHHDLDSIESPLRSHRELGPALVMPLVFQLPVAQGGNLGIREFVHAIQIVRRHERSHVVTNTMRCIEQCQNECSEHFRRAPLEAMPGSFVFVGRCPRADGR